VAKDIFNSTKTNTHIMNIDIQGEDLTTAYMLGKYDGRKEAQ